MPRVKIDYVVSFSSEDSDNPASNLLAWEISKKKWLCAKGEPSCSVVLQLPKAVQISQVDIGAYDTALVEVLVGRSERPSDPFEVLVPRCVLLSPAEARAGGAARVRSLGAAALAAGARAARWDRVRVVCSQPYNRHCQYGLSFVHIFEPEATAAGGEGAARAAGRAALALAADDGEDEFRPGELFAQHRARAAAAATATTATTTGAGTTTTTTTGAGTTTTTTTGAGTDAQIRRVTSRALKNMEDSSTKIVKAPISKTGGGGKIRQEETWEASADGRRHGPAPGEGAARPGGGEGGAPRGRGEGAAGEPRGERGAGTAGEPQGGRGAGAAGEPRGGRGAGAAGEPRGGREAGAAGELRGERGAGAAGEPRGGRGAGAAGEPRGGREAGAAGELRGERGAGAAGEPRGERGAGAAGEPQGERGAGKRKRSDERKDSLSGRRRAALRGAVVALSGFQHPERGRLRELALAMGAQYDRDAGPRTTHLVCAFPNTPKLRALRAAGGAGAAVRASWLRACWERGRRVPWRPHAADPAAPPASPPASDDDAAGGGTPEPESDAEGDTDDEIEKVLREKRRRPSSPRGDDDDGALTEAESPPPGPPAAGRAPCARALPAPLAGRVLALGAGAALAGCERARLARYVRACGGLMAQDGAGAGAGTADCVVTSRARGPRSPPHVRPRRLLALLAAAMRP